MNSSLREVQRLEQTVSFSAGFVALLQRDLRLAFKSNGEWLNPLSFLLIVLALFPLAVTPSNNLLMLIAPGIVWIAALLSTLISVDRLFREDFDDGSMELLLASPQPTFIFAAAKLLAHWLITGLPLVIIAPVLAATFYLPADAVGMMALSLLLGTPSLTCISVITAALTVNLRNSGLLVALITLPLYTPVLIFGSGAVLVTLANESAKGPLLMLAAFLVLGVSLAPFAIASALKLNVANS